MTYDRSDYHGPHLVLGFTANVLANNQTVCPFVWIPSCHNTSTSCGPFLRCSCQCLDYGSLVSWHPLVHKRTFHAKDAPQLIFFFLKKSLGSCSLSPGKSWFAVILNRCNYGWQNSCLRKKRGCHNNNPRILNGFNCTSPTAKAVHDI